MMRRHVSFRLLLQTVAVLLLLVVVEGRPFSFFTRRISTTSSSIAPAPRGGSAVATMTKTSKQQQQQKQAKQAADEDVLLTDYVAVSTLVYSSSTSDLHNQHLLQAGCTIIPKSSSTSKSNGILWTTKNIKKVLWQGRALWERNTPALWKSVAFLSDVVVLVLPPKDDESSYMSLLDANLVQALRAGYQARCKDSALPKSSLVIVLPDGCDENVYKQRLANDLSSLTPKLLHSIHIIVPPSSSATGRSTSVAQQLDQFMAMQSSRSGSAGGVCRMADVETFPSLLQQVHRAFGGGNKKLLLEIVAAPTEPQTKMGLPGLWKQLAGKQQPENATAATATPTTTATIFPDEVQSDEEDLLLVDSQQQRALQAQEQILEYANQRLDELQAKLDDETWAVATLTDSNKVPIISSMTFAHESKTLIQVCDRMMRRLVPVPAAETAEGAAAVALSVQETIVSQVSGRVRQLYQQHLQSLRNYFGKLFEEETIKINSSSKRTKNADDDPQAVATRVTDAFRKAALEAIPFYSGEGAGSSMFVNMESYEHALTVAESGLVADMMEAMIQIEEDWDLQEMIADPADATSAAEVEKPAWLKKLAARALVFGVNYLQGWLAWQGIKRAALEREQQMPKFPLF